MDSFDFVFEVMIALVGIIVVGLTQALFGGTVAAYVAFFYGGCLCGYALRKFLGG